MMREGAIVDATLIATPRSTKYHDGERDPEMHQSAVVLRHEGAYWCGHGEQVDAHGGWHGS